MISELIGDVLLRGHHQSVAADTIVYYRLKEAKEQDQNPRLLRELLENVYTTATSLGSILPRLTGFISALASLTIIYIISTSSKKYSSIYHRIMTALSIINLFVSIAMGLTTLPMPKNNEIIDSYGLQGLKLGNFNTCTAQGFIVFFGMVASYSYLSSLCIYHTYTISYSIPGSNVIKVIEPLFHIFPLVLGFALSLPYVFFQQYNPSPSELWCTVQRLPHLCTSTNTNTNDEAPEECVRGHVWCDTVVDASIYSFLVVNYLVICACLYSIISQFRKQSRLIEQYLQRHIRGLSTTLAHQLQMRNTKAKVAIFQLIAYVLASCITVAFQILTSIGFLTGAVDDYYPVLKLLKVTLQPLQGCFHFIIFVTGNVVNMCLTDPSLSYKEVWSKLFCRNRSEIGDFDIVAIHFLENENGDMEPIMNIPGQTGAVSTQVELSNINRRRSSISSVDSDRDELAELAVVPSRRVKKKLHIKRRGNKLKAKEQGSHGSENGASISSCQRSSLDLEDLCNAPSFIASSGVSSYDSSIIY